MKNGFVLSGMRWSKNNEIDQSKAGQTDKKLGQSVSEREQKGGIKRLAQS